MGNDHVIVLYPVSINIVLNSVARLRVMVSINKNSVEYVIVTLRPDIY